MRSRILATVAVTTLTALVAAGLGTAPAFADNATVTAPFGAGRHVEARVFKDAGNSNPHYATSVWTYNGAALWSVTTVTDVTKLYANSVGGFSVSCDGHGCGGSVSTSTPELDLSWTNGNTYESDLSGQMYVSPLTISTKACVTGYGYSQPLGLHSANASTCVGWL